MLLKKSSFKVYWALSSGYNYYQESFDANDNIWTNSSFMFGYFRPKWYVSAFAGSTFLNYTRSSNGIFVNQVNKWHSNSLPSLNYDLNVGISIKRNLDISVTLIGINVFRARYSSGLNYSNQRNFMAFGIVGGLHYHF